MILQEKAEPSVATKPGLRDSLKWLVHRPGSLNPAVRRKGAGLMLINRTCHTLIFVLTIAQFGCGTKPPSHVLSPTENFEAEWKCVDKPDRSIYIGEKR